MASKIKTEKSCTLYVDGMHCAACEILIEKKASKIQGISSVDARLNKGTIEIKGDSTISAEQFANEITKLVKNDGYSVHVEKPGIRKAVNWRDFYYAIPMALLIIVLFVGLQILGIVNLVNPQTINYPAIFLIGVVASLSSCAAVVGGLVLSLSANMAKEGSSKTYLPHIMFHVSRLVGFFVLGGLIGIIGSAFTLSRGINFALSFTVGLVMVILALNLLDIFDFTKKLQLKMPKSFSHTLLKTENASSKFASLFLGAVTFFLPCGFTQSMQIYSLSTGNFLNGAITMFVFALGTLPVLGIISFASVNLAQNVRSSGVFFKTAGLIVLFFAILNFLGALIVLGKLPPILIKLNLFILK